MEVNIPSEPSLMHNFVRKDPITQGTQCSKTFAEHEVRSFKNCHISTRSTMIFIRFSGEHDNGDLQGGQHASRRGWLAEGHQH